jgi:uncharacterized protein YgbK (DUF1537 family)
LIRHLIADDLTGAADSSVHFAGQRQVLISLPAPRLALGWHRPESADLLVLDTESRNLLPAPAASLMAAACEGLGDGVFKKVDSTLRGPVAAELEAARVALGRTTTVVAPSLPAQGRIVRAGRLLVDGVDVGNVVDLIGGVPDHLVVADAATDEDLDRIAAECALRPDVLPAGSAGLAAAFARLEGSAAPTTVPVVRRVLVAVASRHPAARAQLAFLRYTPHADIEVAAVPHDANGDPAELVASFGRDVADRATDLGDGIVVLATGGDAALAICRALGLATIRPRAEVLPGVVWSETEREGLSIATKAGGFGGPRLLHDAALKLLGVDSHG